jgi:hypothetical protein
MIRRGIMASKRRLAVIDCGKFPSKDNCQIKITAPEDQVEKIIDLATYHACNGHEHQDSLELRNQIRSCIEYIEE